MKDTEDAVGHAMHDYLTGKGEFEIVERNDGLVTVSPGPDLYFSEYDDWSSAEKGPMLYVSGRLVMVEAPGRWPAP